MKRKEVREEGREGQGQWEGKSIIEHLLIEFNGVIKLIDGELLLLETEEWSTGGEEEITDVHSLQGLPVLLEHLH